MVPKRVLALTLLSTLFLTLSGCWHGIHVPPGQVRKQAPPGHLKKHTGLLPHELTIKIR